MRDRERESDHEAQWARELDKPQAPNVERQAKLAEERLRDDGASLAEVRSQWSTFDRDNPMEGDAINREFVRAQNLAYARVVDGLLRAEVGEGLRERHAQPDVDDDFADLLSDRQERARINFPSAARALPAAPEPARLRDNPDSEARPLPAAPAPQPEPVRLRDNPDSEARPLPAAPGRPAAPARLRDSPDSEARPLTAAPDARAPEARPAEARISDAERLAARADAAERIVRPTSPNRPTDTRPEDWYLGRANALDERPRGSVDREVARLKDLPQLSTREAVRNVIAHTAEDFEQQRENGVDNERLRTRLYALAVVHELRAREEIERLREPPEAPTLPEARVRSEAERAPPLERTDPARPLPSPSTERDQSAASEPRVMRFVPREETDPRERDNGPTIPDQRLPSSTSSVFAALREERPKDDSTNPARRNVRAPAPPERAQDSIELSTRDIVVDHDREDDREDREDDRDREDADPSLSTRLSERHRERSADLRRELASVAATADRELFSLTRDADVNPAAARLVAQVNETVERIRSTPRSHDPVDLSARVNELQELERTDPDVTDGRLRVERLAYGALAREAFERENQLLGTATRDAMAEVQRMPEEERRAFIAEARFVLREPAYNDRNAMNRELLRDENPRITQLAALARSTASVQELERQAKWRDDAGFDARVDAAVAVRLTTPERDGELVDALAEARVQAVLARDLTERRRAHDLAVELAEVVRRLPISRSLDLETPASPYRPLHN